MTKADAAAPVVSIGVPVYNGDRLLARALDSLCGQHFSEMAIIISDNASTDGTEQICRTYAARDPRIRYHRQPRNLGAAANFNFVFQQARGRFFKWAAHDDVLAPGYLTACVEALTTKSDAVLSSTEAGLINDDGSALSYDAERRAFIDRYGKFWHWAPEPETGTSSADPVRRFASLVLRDSWCLEVFGLIRTEALRRTSLIGAYYGSDKILLAELATIGRFHKVPEPLFLRGCQPEQSSYLSPQQQAAWIRGKQTRSFDQGWMAWNLLRASLRPDLSLSQKLACAGCVARHAVKPEKLKRLLVPGPNNYFGIGAGVGRN